MRGLGQFDLGFSFFSILDRREESMEEQIFTPKIKNGSIITIGIDNGVSKLTITVDKHFNLFQKKMIEWCFGFKVEDYTEE